MKYPEKTVEKVEIRPINNQLELTVTIKKQVCFIPTIILNIDATKGQEQATAIVTIPLFRTKNKDKITITHTFDNTIVLCAILDNKYYIIPTISMTINVSDDVNVDAIIPI